MTLTLCFLKDSHAQPDRADKPAPAGHYYDFGELAAHPLRFRLFPTYTLPGLGSPIFLWFFHDVSGIISIVYGTQKLYFYR
jgi:hypothetical protein